MTITSQLISLANRTASSPSGLLRRGRGSEAKWQISQAELAEFSDSTGRAADLFDAGTYKQAAQFAAAYGIGKVLLAPLTVQTVFADTGTAVLADPKNR